MGESFIADTPSPNPWDHTVKVVVPIASMNESPGLPNGIFPKSSSVLCPRVLLFPRLFPLDDPLRMSHAYIIKHFFVFKKLLFDGCFSYDGCSMFRLVFLLLHLIIILT